MKGDGYIKIKIKFLGAGLEDKYQVSVKIYDNQKLIVNSQTYNGEICLMLKKNKVYRLQAIFFNDIINTYFYTNNNVYLFRLSNNIIFNRTITLSLKDYYYNIPIEKGEIILWPRQ